MADLSKMITLAGKECSKAQWTMLVEQSGLRIAHIHNYEDAVTFVIVLEPERTEP
jgi:demethylsterigmatocystin 6-O-methyltransferase